MVGLPCMKQTNLVRSSTQALRSDRTSRFFTILLAGAALWCCLFVTRETIYFAAPNHQPQIHECAQIANPVRLQSLFETLLVVVASPFTR